MPTLERLKAVEGLGFATHPAPQAPVTGIFFYLDTKYTTRYVIVQGHRDFRVFSTRRTPAWRNGLHHLKLR